MDSKDLDVLLEEDGISKDGKKYLSMDISKEEEIDDLQSLKQDVGDILLDDPLEKVKKKITKKNKGQESIPQHDSKIVNEKKFTDLAKMNEGGTELFDAGKEEKQLLELSKFVEMKIPSTEWKEISGNTKADKYVVQEGDWLWKISKTLFGTGFYYSKIWSLNPHIKNPHEITPGMVLVFDSGSEDDIPKIHVGSFPELEAGKGKSKLFDFKEYGEDTKPTWMREREKLLSQGLYFQYSSESTYEDIAQIGKTYLLKEYEKYEPPLPDIIIAEPEGQYDDTGFDKESKIVFNYKEGFFLNTFITTNIVQDLGEIIAFPQESVFINKFDKIYVKLDESVKAKPGDKFSIYNSGGKISHHVSDRAGYQYTITAQIQTVRRVNRLWECKVIDLSGIVQRGDRVTIYTPKIDKINRVFTKRNIEAAIIEAFHATANGLSFGDVVYLDRGRADGVELGTVFELFSFLDRGTGKQISPDPTYKIGELTVITLTDNFSTALVSNSSSEIQLGSIALTKSPEAAAKASKRLRVKSIDEVDKLKSKALEELDVELDLDDVGENLLDQADNVKLTEDELEELERQEREKSIIKDHEKDLQELERLENEIVEAESKLNETKLDEDKFLEEANLENIEKTEGTKANAFDDLNEIESEIGVKYMDEKMDSKDNPYGLSEHDLEEIDMLLNTEEEK